MNRTRDLLHLYFDDALDETGLAELERLLETDAGARRDFVAMAHEQGLLAETLRGDADLLMRGVGEKPARGRTERLAAPLTRRRIAALRARPAPAPAWVRALPWAAAGLIALGAATLILGGHRRQEPVPEPASALARDAAPPHDAAVRVAEALPPASPAPAGEKAPAPPRTPGATETAAVTGPDVTPIAPAPREAPVHPDAPGIARDDPAPAPVAPAPEVRPTVVLAGGLSSAIVERLQGGVFVLTGTGRHPAQAGHRLLPGEGVRTEADGRAALGLPDGTALELDGETTLRDAPTGGITRSVIAVEGGTVRADIRPQPSDRPLLFVTPHAEALVLGTRLALVVAPGSTRLEVRQGRVRLTRRPDGKSVEVGAGQSAVAAPDAALQVGKLLTLLAFQDGVSPTPAYTGTRDTTISREGEPPDIGMMKTCRVAGRPSKGAIRETCALLRWDLSAIPPGSAVVSATLALHVDTASARQAFDIVELKRPWNEVEATWTSATRLMPWARRGAQDETDRGTAVLGTAPAEAREGLATLPLSPQGVAAVQAWVNQPAANLGVILVNNRNAEALAFASREMEIPSRRPRLIVAFTPPDGAGR